MHTWVVWNGEKRKVGETGHGRAQGRDGAGDGNTNTVELLVHLLDINDNTPMFFAERYEFFLLENLPWHQLYL